MRALGVSSKKHKKLLHRTHTYFLAFPNSSGSFLRSRSAVLRCISGSRAVERRSNETKQRSFVTVLRHPVTFTYIWVIPDFLIQMIHDAVLISLWHINTHIYVRFLNYTF